MLLADFIQTEIYFIFPSSSGSMVKTEADEDSSLLMASVILVSSAESYLLRTYLVRILFSFFSLISQISISAFMGLIRCGC